MDPHLYPTSFLFFIITIFILIHVPTYMCADNEQYVNCSQLIQCGNNITNIGYPFWGGNRPDYCGHPGFELNCSKGDAPLITIASTTYRALGINNETRILTVAREDFWNNTCPQFLYNTTLNFTLFSYNTNTQNVTLYYNCPSLPTGTQTQLIPSLFECNTNGTASSISYYTTTDVSLPSNISPGTCNNSLFVPVILSAVQGLASTTPSITLGEALDRGFELQWTANDTSCAQCVDSGGRCGSDSSSAGSFTCYCADQPYASVCNGTGGGGVRENVSLTVGLAIGGAVIFGLGLGWFVFSWRQKRKRLAAQSAQTESKDLPSPSSKVVATTPSTYYSQSVPSYPSLSSNSDFGKGSTYFGVQVFSYTELEEATDNFNPSRELGEGGFGTVYYGKLHDGRIVAVKRLYENNFKRVEQFMNEVEILTHLRHQNLVMLFGCTSKRSRELLLVYEYIPNGTVADHLHGKRANSGLLSWPVRLSIAIETADALAYLHSSDIIHRDVKTNNILLDNDFRVKVADFGLSRLFPTDVTHVSTAPQGTPGYVDPEYYQCYQLTSKSDVYSFGVVLIELISSKLAVDTNRHRHDINLANMAINKIQNHTLHELVDPSLGFETNSSVRTMTTLVAELAFRCLQQERDSRPSMEEVLEGLKRIKNEDLSVERAEVVDILEDDVGLIKVNPPPMSPDSSVNEKWVSSSTTLNSSG